MNKEFEYYVATKDNKGDFLIYSSDNFKLSEIDLINLIKICFIEARNKTIGKKLISIYRDSTQHRIHLTKERLSLIGIKEEENPNPIRMKGGKK